MHLTTPCPHCHHPLTLTGKTITCTHCPYTVSFEQLPVNLTVRQLDRLIRMGQLRVVVSTPNVHALMLTVEEEA